MTDLEYYRKRAVAELARVLESAPANGAADQALDAAIRAAKGLPDRPEGVAPYVRLFPAPPDPVPMPALATLVGAHATAWHAPLNTALREAYITNPLEVAHFLAQVLHETGGLKWLEEIWGPTPTQERYEGRADLGNVLPGDGYLYRGRGLIHLTGRHNYGRAGQALGLPLVEQPDLAARPEHAARIACWYWNSRALGWSALRDDLEAVTRGVNGGINGMADRAKWLARAKAALGLE